MKQLAIAFLAGGLWLAAQTPASTTNSAQECQCAQKNGGECGQCQCGRESCQRGSGARGRGMGMRAGAGKGSGKGMCMRMNQEQSSQGSAKGTRR